MKKLLIISILALSACHKKDDIKPTPDLYKNILWRNNEDTTIILSIKDSTFLINWGSINIIDSINYTKKEDTFFTYSNPSIKERTFVMLSRIDDTLHWSAYPNGIKLTFYKR